MDTIKSTSTNAAPISNIRFLSTSASLSTFDLSNIWLTNYGGGAVGIRSACR
jgi:hypothetical protein